MITSGFPRRSETFALNELIALEERQALAGIFATKPGDGTIPQPGASRLAQRVAVLPPGNPTEQAKAIARRLNGKGGHIAGVHGYFAHAPAAVAMETGRLLGVPFGFSVHARDARKIDSDELGRRAGRASCLIACNPDVAGDLRRAGSNPLLVPHGVDLRRFHPRSGRPPDSVVKLLAVGRLVEKKGFAVLLHAVASTSAAVHLTIIGDGPERRHLSRLIDDLELQGRATLGGPRTHADLPRAYEAADVVVVPSVVDGSGDRDGLPNVVLEAMAAGLPVIASSVGAIETAVTDGVTGFVVPAGDHVALAHGVEELAREPRLRKQLGDAARKSAEERFDLARCTNRLCRVLEDAYA